MSSIAESDQSFVRPESNDNSLVNRPDGLEYGTQNLPILLRLPDVSIVANNTQPIGTRSAVGTSDVEAVAASHPVVPTDASISSATPVPETANTGYERRRRDVGRRRAVIQTREASWLPGAGQIIVAALIAGVLLVAVVVLRGKRPSHSVARDPAPEVNTLNTFAGSSSTPTDSLSVRSSGPNRTSSDVASGQEPTIPTFPDSTSPDDTAAPSLDAPSLDNGPDFNTARSRLPTSSVNATPNVVDNQTLAPNGSRQLESSQPRAIPPAYPTTSRPAYSLGRAETASSSSGAWSETVPMGTIRQAHKPRDNQQYYQR